MHAGSEPLMIGDSAAQIGQLERFFGGESGAEFLLMFGRNARDLPKHLPPPFREKQCVVAAILCAPTPLDNTLAFKLIHQGNHAAGHHPKMFGQGLLAYPRVRADFSKQPHVGWS